MASLVVALSDTHMPRGARRLSPACLAVLEAADLILHAGDLVSLSVLDLLRPLARVEAVHGNADDAETRATLPVRTVAEVEGVRIGLVHDPGRAAGRGERLRDAFPGCGAVVFGHTHVPAILPADGLVLVNPGSPTERRRAPARTVATLRIEDGRVEAALVEV